MARDDGDLYLHLRQDRGGYAPMQVNAPEPMDFEMGNFSGRCLFLHRPEWSFDSPESCDTYPYKEHFHGRKRLWEIRIQGQFKRRPGVLYCGIELEEYVPVSWGTKAIMKGLLPLVKKALNCNTVNHELGREGDTSLRPACVAPVWAADNTLVHSTAAEAPQINQTTLPTGFGRKAAREFWEDLWSGGGPSWNTEPGGPVFTFAIWGVSPLMDLQGWVFRKLPLTWGRDLPLEPFCGRQPTHAVFYELEDDQCGHHQENKKYMWNCRVVPEHIWTDFLSMNPGSSPGVRISSGASFIDDDVMSFCSAMSHGSDPENLFERELSQDFDDIISDMEEKPPPTMSQTVRSVVKKRLSEYRNGKAASVARRVAKCSGVRPLVRHLKPLVKQSCNTKRILLCASVIVALLFFLNSGMFSRLPAVRVVVDWNATQDVVVATGSSR
jgi:hypothetical protein